MIRSAAIVAADAVSGAATGDEVVVAPGNHVVSSVVGLAADSVVVRGPAAAPQPRVSRTASTLLVVSGSGVTVRDLRLEAADAPGEYVVNEQAKDNLLVGWNGGAPDGSRDRGGRRRLPLRAVG